VAVDLDVAHCSLVSILVCICGSTWCCHRNASAGGDLFAMGNRAAADIGRLRFVGTGKQSLRDAH